jgi:hypothetical protein
MFVEKLNKEMTVHYYTKNDNRKMTRTNDY